MMYMILWFNHNVMDVVNVVTFYSVFISDTTNEFLPGDAKDLLNWTELRGKKTLNPNNSREGQNPLCCFTKVSDTKAGKWHQRTTNWPIPALK